MLSLLLVFGHSCYQLGVVSFSFVSGLLPKRPNNVSSPLLVFKYYPVVGYHGCRHFWSDPFSRCLVNLFFCFFVLMPCQLFQLSEGRENLEFYFSKYNGFCVRKKTKEEEEKDKKRKRKKDRIFRVPVPLHQCFG